MGLRGLALLVLLVLALLVLDELLGWGAVAAAGRQLVRLIDWLAFWRAL